MEASTPHRCLRTADIQMLIFKLLTKEDCLNLSITCSSFYEEAVNVVWANVSSLVPFARCMLPDIMVEVVTEGDRSWGQYSSSLDFVREPTAYDWHAFCKHTHRVRGYKASTSLIRSDYSRAPDGTILHQGLGGSSSFTSRATKAISRFIIQRCTTGSHGTASGLFPKLKQLQLYVSGYHWVPDYLPYLCGEMLQSFTASFGIASPWFPKDTDTTFIPFAETLPAMRARWPHLMSLKLPQLTGNEENAINVHIEEISQWLESLTRLEHLEISTGCHRSLIWALSENPPLRTLKLLYHDKPPPHITLDFPSSSLRSRFRLLKELSLEIPTPETPVHFLQALNGSRTLTNLDISLFSMEDTTPSLVQALAVIEAVSHLPAIDFLELSFSYHPSREAILPEVPPLDTPLFAKLFRLGRLRHLKLRGFFDISITDQDLRDAANSWPGLEDIRLALYDPARAPFEVDQVPVLSLVGVQALYNGCSCLQTIDLPVNDVIPFTADGTLDLPSAQRTSTLESLSLTFYCMDEDFEYRSEEYIPMIIRLMFPQLKQLKTVHYDEEEIYPPGSDSEWWDKKVQTRWESYRDTELEKVRTLLAETLEALRADAAEEAEEPESGED